MGDVLGITDSNGTLVAEYRYDAYGKPVKILDGNGNDVSTNYAHIANINPIRYRGYYYDIETGFYYLNSRYYDPEIGRFINADNSELLIEDSENLTQYNLFAYCWNNPVNMADYNGDIPRWVINGYKFLIQHTPAYSMGKSAIAGAAFSFLNLKGYSLSSKMFSHGMYGRGKDLSASVKKSMIKLLKKDYSFNQKIQGFINNSNGNSFYKVGSHEFTSGDLYYSIQKCNYYISGTKSRATGLWDIYITLTDTYNFDDPIRLFKYGLSLGNAANDLGWHMQRIGMITPYKWSVSYGDNFWG